MRVISKNELTAELNQHNPLILHLSACACNDSNSKLDSTLFNVSNSQKKVQVPIPLVVLNICKSTELALDLLSKQFARIVLFSPIHVESSIGNKFFEGFYGKLANFKTSIDYDSCFHAYSSAISSLLSNSKLRQVPFLLYASTDLQDAFDRKQRQIQQSPTPLSNALVLKAALTRTNTNTISNYVSNTDNNNDSLAGLDFASVYALQFIKDSSSSDKSPCLLLLQTSSNSPLVNDIQSAAIRSWHPTLQVPVVLTFSPESRSISKQDLDFFNVVAGTSLKTLQNCEAIPLPPLIYLINLSQLTFISNSSHDILHDLLLKRFPRAPMIVFGLSEYESDLHDICVQANATELTVYRVLPIKSLNHSKFYTTAIDSSSISSILKEKILKFNELKDISNNDRSDGRKALRPEQFIPIPRLFIIIPSRNNSAALHFVCEEPHCHHIVPIYQHAGYTIGKLTSFVSKYFKHIAVGIQVLDKTDGCESRKAILNQLLSEFQKKETEKLLKSYESDKMSVLRELSKNNDLFQLESELTDFNRAQEWGVKHILLRGRYHWLCEEHALNYQEGRLDCLLNSRFIWLTVPLQFVSYHSIFTFTLTISDWFYQNLYKCGICTKLFFVYFKILRSEGD